MTAKRNAVQLLTQKKFCYRDIFGVGNLDILVAAADEVDIDAGLFDHAGVVGEIFLVGLEVGFF